MRGDPPDTGDLIERGHRLVERGDLGGDLVLEVGDVGFDLVDPGQHLGRQPGVVVGEVPVKVSPRSLILPRSRVRASCARTFGSRCPATIAPSMARPEAPKMSDATTDSLMQASSSSFSTRFFSAVQASTKSTR